MMQLVDGYSRDDIKCLLHCFYLPYEPAHGILITYRIGQQGRLRQACPIAQSHHTLRCLHTHSRDIDEGSNKNLGL